MRYQYAAQSAAQSPSGPRHCYCSRCRYPPDLPSLSANQGYAPAQCNLGYCYKNGKGVEQNCDAAVEWYIKAASQGNVTAQYNLAICYESGDGVEQDYKKAIEYYTLAAENGNKNAAEALEILNAKL